MDFPNEIFESPRLIITDLPKLPQLIDYQEIVVLALT